MTRDQLSELRRLSTEVQQWIEWGNGNAPPLDDIRRLAQLAQLAANVIELKDFR